MCWSTPSDENCSQCVAIFGMCTHNVRYRTESGNVKCVFCDIEVTRIIPPACVRRD